MGSRAQVLVLLHVLRKRAVCWTSLEPQLRCFAQKGLRRLVASARWSGHARRISAPAEALVGAEVFRHGALGLPLKALQGQLHLRESNAARVPSHQKEGKTGAQTEDSRMSKKAVERVKRKKGDCSGLQASSRSLGSSNSPRSSGPPFSGPSSRAVR